MWTLKDGRARGCEEDRQAGKPGVQGCGSGVDMRREVGSGDIEARSERVFVPGRRVIFKGRGSDYRELCPPVRPPSTAHTTPNKDAHPNQLHDFGGATCPRLSLFSSKIRQLD